MSRLLSRPVFDTLTIADKLRAYLVLRTTPVSFATLKRISGSMNPTAALAADYFAGLIVRRSSGQYLCTRKGRTAFIKRLPRDLLGVAVELPQ